MSTSEEIQPPPPKNPNLHESSSSLGCLPLLGHLRSAAQVCHRNHPQECVRMCAGQRNEGLSWATKLCEGHQRTMEDHFTSLGDFMRLSCRDFGGCVADHAAAPAPIYYFGVFDGHGGQEISRFCAINLHHLLKQEWERLSSSSRDVTAGWRERWEIAFRRAFERADDAFRGRMLMHRSGSTACIVLVSPCQIVAASCGDSRAILSHHRRLTPLTRDHKPQNKQEAERIEGLGGRIIGEDFPRVEGLFPLTRAIGDHELKRLVISTPEVTFMERKEDDEFVVLATDGIWGAMSNKKAAKVVRKKLRKRKSNKLSYDTNSKLPASLAVDKLVNMALRRGDCDNIAVTVIDLKSQAGA